MIRLDTLDHILAEWLLPPADKQADFHLHRVQGDILEAARQKPRATPPKPALVDGTRIVKQIIQRPIPIKPCPWCGTDPGHERGPNGLVYKPHAGPEGRACAGGGRTVHGAIELIPIPVYGKQGMGKSKLVNHLVEWIVEQHGLENVHCLISNDFRALQANIDPRKPVQVLFLDDALDSAFSRGGTPTALRDAIKDFFKTRHKLEKSIRVLNGESVDAEAETMDDMHYAGLVYFFIGSQSFKALEKQFRPGLCIFKSPLEEDNLEITAFWMGSSADQDLKHKQATKAWELLFEVQRRKMEDHDFAALSTSIVVAPSRGPMILRTSMPKREFFEPPTGRRVRFEQEKPETEIEQRARVTAHLAQLFSQQYDPRAQGAQGHLRVFIKDYFLQLARGDVDDPFLRVGDHVAIQKGDVVREVLDRAKTLKREGTAPTGHVLEAEDALIRELATAWLGAGGDPLKKKDGVAASRLYTFIAEHCAHDRDKRLRAEALRQKIMWMATSLRSARLAQEEGDETPRPQMAQPERPLLTGPTFTFDVSEEVAHLPERMASIAARKGRNEQEARALWTHKAKAWRRVKIERMSREDLELLSQEEFGRHLTGRQLGTWAKEVESALGLVMGTEYERWMEQRLQEGWRHKGLRDAPIQSVRRGGGSGHEPDLVITYADNHVDYWSLKAYSAKEHVTLSLRNMANQKPSDIAPELAAFTHAWEARETARLEGAPLPPTPRLCIIFREVLTPGAEFFRIFTTPESIQPTMPFNRGEIGTPTQAIWTLPSPAPPADREAARA